MNRRQLLIVTCVVATLAACSAPTAGTSPGSVPVSTTAAAPVATPSQDLSSLDWSRIALPVSALDPALTPPDEPDGGALGMLCASPSDWSKAVPSGWLPFKDSQAVVPDPGRGRYNLGWWMSLFEPAFGQLADGRQIAAVPMACGPNGGNGNSNVLLVFDAVGGSPGRPHLIAMFQPTGVFAGFGTGDVAVVNGRIKVTWHTVGPHDPRANPTVKHAGTVDLIEGRLVPSWPDDDVLRATLWEEPPGATSSPSAAPTPVSTESGDLAGVDWKSFTLPVEPLAAGLAALHCGPSLAVLRAAFPDGRVRFSYRKPLRGFSYSAGVEAFVPDRSVKVIRGLPGKAGWLLLISDPTLGTLDGGVSVAAFSLECMAAIPGDGWPVTLVVVDGTGGGPNPLGIYNAGQYINSIAVARGQVVAEVGVEGPWQGKLTISEAGGRLASSLKPDKGSDASGAWKDVELWTRS